MVLPYSVVGLRLTEVVILGLLILVVALLFLRRRPAGLVWVSVLLMGALLAHLLYDEARWQMVPAYAVIFFLAIWLGIPSRRRYRAAGLVARIVIAVLFTVPAIALPLVMPVFQLPPPSGPYPIGVVGIAVPTIDAVGQGDPAGRLQLTIRYPATPSHHPAAPYWSRDAVRDHRLPGLPWIASTHLLVVPTNGRLRAPLAEVESADTNSTGARPLAFFAPGDEDLPSDHIVILEELASLGWVVVSLPVGATAPDARAVAARLQANTLDQAFAGQVDTVRSVVLQTESSHLGDLGLPTVTLHSEGPLATARWGDRAMQLSVAGATIPSAARTARYLLVRPSRFLVGSSDVAAPTVIVAIRAFVTSLVADGSASSAVFSGQQPDTSFVSELLPAAAILPISQ